MLTSWFGTSTKNTCARQGGFGVVPYAFYREAFQLIQEHLNSLSEKEFEEKQVGMVCIVVSTGYFGRNENRTTRLEQFRFVGFSKSEIIEILAAVKPQLLE